MEEEKQKKAEIDLEELKKNAIKEAVDKIISEVLIVSDKSTGRTIELQSGGKTMEELNEIGWIVWNSYFPQNTKRPSYV